MARLSDPITILKGVGPAKAKQFANLNIFTLQDLICHFPRGYEDRTKLLTIDKLEIDVPACFKAMVMNTPRTQKIRKGLDITRVQVADHTARLSLTFFNNRFAAENLQYGKEYIFYGTLSGDYAGYGMTNPVFESLESNPVTTRLDFAYLSADCRTFQCCHAESGTAGLGNLRPSGRDFAPVCSGGIRHSSGRAGLLCHSRACIHDGSGNGEETVDL